MYKQENIKPYDANAEKGAQVASMFNNIAHSYDFLNHSLSLGIDRIWRNTAIGSLRKYRPQQILDVATGTGDFAILASRKLKPERVTGIDISEGMLAIGRAKVERLGLADRIKLMEGDCMDLPFADAAFDAVTVAYGVRNFADLDRGLREMWRVLRPGGRLVVIEIAEPCAFPMKQLFRLYSKVVMPLVGKIVSRDGSAYRYLPATMQAFPHGPRFVEALRRAGFDNPKHNSFVLGINTLYEAEK